MQTNLRIFSRLRPLDVVEAKLGYTGIAKLDGMSVSLLEQLHRAKAQFGPDIARRVAKLLVRAKSLRLRDADQLISLHETVLYLRAYPQSAQVLQLTDELLLAFGARLEGLSSKFKSQRPKQFPAQEFEYAEVSGIAGTGLSTNFSHPVARDLVRRHGRDIHIDWNKYEHPERLARTLARLIPESFGDWAISPHADWQAWFEKAGGNLAWLIEQVEPEVYDLFELPLRWELGDSKASRTLARIPLSIQRDRKTFYHDGPFIGRADVSIETEFSLPPIRVRPLSSGSAKQIVSVIIDASAVRYRELYGFEYPDVSSVFHAHLGRGMDLFFFGVPRKWKLPNRQYCSGMYFKNGVPIGYVEVTWSNGQMEIGFNLYYTFRQGETAWLYARLMKLFRERFGARSFMIDSYQLGHENEEAIESGAFWFYYKLGFRPASESATKLAAREMEKIAQRPGYRTSAAILRKLAKTPLIYG